MQNHWCDLLSNLTGLVNMIQNKTANIGISTAASRMRSSFCQVSPQLEPCFDLSNFLCVTGVSAASACVLVCRLNLFLESPLGSASSRLLTRSRLPDSKTD